jgi:hypothetical protein
LSKSSSKYGLGIRDPRSGKNPFRIPDPGIKKAQDPGSRIPDPQHCNQVFKTVVPSVGNKMEMKMRCCGSRMYIPDPGSGFFAIPDSGSPFPDAKNHKKEEGEK